MKFFNRRTIFITIVSLFIILAGCSKSNPQPSTTTPTPAPGGNTQTPSGSAEQQIELTFTNWLSVEDATKDIFNTLVAEFESQNPGIKIKSVGIPFNQFKDQVIVSSLGGNPPDVTQANQNFSSAFVGAGIAEPLDGLLDQAILDDIVEGSKAGVTYDGKVMAMPWAPHPNALFWNKGLFVKAGLDPEKPPTTHDELIEMAKQIAALGKDEQGNPIYGYAVASSSVSNSGNFFLGTVLGFGGQFVNDQGEVVFDEGTALQEALEEYKMLLTSGVSPVGADQKEIRNLFGTGTLGFAIDGDFGRSVFRDTSGKGEAFDEEWGVTTIPVHNTGRSETIFTEHQLLVMKGSEHKEAAAKFVEFLVSKEAMIAYHESNGILSARKSIAALPEMNEDLYAEVFNKQMSTATALPTANPMFDNAMKETTSMIQLMSQGQDAQKAIEQIMPRIKELYK